MESHISSVRRHTGGGRIPGGWMAQLGPLALLTATAMYLQLKWDAIPARFPVHWGIDGQPNGWSNRTPIGVYGPLLLGAVILAAIALTSYATRRSSRAVRGENTSPIANEVAQRMGIFLLALEFFIAVIFCFVGLLPFIGSPGITPIVVAMLVFLVTLLFLVAWIAKASAQQARETHARADAPAVGAMDQVWKLGVFYFNPDDASVFVPKRFGFGYTLNFAHPSAWICMGAVLLLPAVILLFILHQR